MNAIRNFLTFGLTTTPSKRLEENMAGEEHPTPTEPSPPITQLPHQAATVMTPQPSPRRYLHSSPALGHNLTPPINEGSKRRQQSTPFTQSAHPVHPPDNSSREEISSPSSLSIPCLRDMKQDMLEYLCHVCLLSDDVNQRQRVFRNLDDLLPLLQLDLHHNTRLRSRLALTALAFGIMRLEVDTSSDCAEKIVENSETSLFNNDNESLGNSEQQEANIDSTERTRFCDLTTEDWEALVQELDQVQHLLLQLPSLTSPGVENASVRQRRHCVAVQSPVICNANSRLPDVSVATGNITAAQKPPAEPSLRNSISYTQHTFHSVRILLKGQVALTTLRLRFNDILLSPYSKENNGSEEMTLDIGDVNSAIKEALDNFVKTFQDGEESDVSVTKYYDDLDQFVLEASTLVEKETSSSLFKSRQRLASFHLFDLLDHLISDLRNVHHKSTSYLYLQQSVRDLLIQWTLHVLGTPVLFQLGYGFVPMSTSTDPLSVNLCQQLQNKNEHCIHKGTDGNAPDVDDLSIFGNNGADVARHESIYNEEAHRQQRDLNAIDEAEEDRLMTQPVALFLGEAGSEEQRQLLCEEPLVSQHHSVTTPMGNKQPNSSSAPPALISVDNHAGPTLLTATIAAKTAATSPPLSREDHALLDRLVHPPSSKTFESSTLVENIEYPRRMAATKSPRNLSSWSQTKTVRNDDDDNTGSYNNNSNLKQHHSVVPSSSSSDSSYATYDDSATQDPDDSSPARKRHIYSNARKSPLRAANSSFVDCEQDRDKDRRRKRIYRSDDDAGFSNECVAGDRGPARHRKVLRKTTSTARRKESEQQEDLLCVDDAHSDQQIQSEDVLFINVAHSGQQNQSERQNAPRLSLEVPPNFVPSSDVNIIQVPLYGRHRVEFTQDETDAIVEGVRRWGVGKWKLIKEYSEGRLERRTTGQIKDKYRNLVRTNQL